MAPLRKQPKPPPLPQQPLGTQTAPGRGRRRAALAAGGGFGTASSSSGSAVAAAAAAASGASPASQRGHEVQQQEAACWPEQLHLPAAITSPATPPPQQSRPGPWSGASVARSTPRQQPTQPSLSVVTDLEGLGAPRPLPNHASAGASKRGDDILELGTPPGADSRGSGGASDLQSEISEAFRDPDAQGRIQAYAGDSQRDGSVEAHQPSGEFGGTTLTGEDSNGEALQDAVRDDDTQAAAAAAIGPNGASVHTPAKTKLLVAVRMRPLRCVRVHAPCSV